tara:strand:+ start:157 stop:528 length:372 start_codon:yes stop_codon:yes gene_type:complete
MATLDVNQYTKYEKARIIGARALQIAMGAPFLVKMSEEDIIELKYNPITIATTEFQKGVIPLTIVRPLPQKITDSGSVEEVGTLGKKLVKEIQNTDIDTPDEVISEQSMKEIIEEMNPNSEEN